MQKQVLHMLLKSRNMNWTEKRKSLRDISGAIAIREWKRLAVALVFAKSGDRVTYSVTIGQFLRQEVLPASIYILDAVTLVLEGRTIGTEERLPSVVLAGVSVGSNNERFEVDRRNRTIG